MKRDFCLRVQLLARRDGLSSGGARVRMWRDLTRCVLIHGNSSAECPPSMVRVRPGTTARNKIYDSSPGRSYQVVCAQPRNPNVSSLYDAAPSDERDSELYVSPVILSARSSPFRDRVTPRVNVDILASRIGWLNANREGTRKQWRVEFIVSGIPSKDVELVTVSYYENNAGKRDRVVYDSAIPRINYSSSLRILTKIVSHQSRAIFCLVLLA